MFVLENQGQPFIMKALSGTSWRIIIHENLENHLYMDVSIGKPCVNQVFYLENHWPTFIDQCFKRNFMDNHV